MLKILQDMLQQYIYQELPDVQAGFKKGKISNICWIMGKKRERERIPEKSSTSALLTTLKPLTVEITTNCGKFFGWWEYQTTLSVSLQICVQLKKPPLKLDTEQQIDSKLGKGNIKFVHHHHVYLTSMQSTSCIILGWMKHK